MTGDELRDLLGREPFRPFRIQVTSGAAYEVRNPAMAVAMRSELFLALPDGDRWVFIPYLHVAAVEALDNGQVPRPPNA